MLGTKIDNKLYDLVGKKVTLNDPKMGPVEVEIMDIVQGQVLYEHWSGETGSISVDKFKEQIVPDEKFF
jgi:bisphosphoglycerate-independent phosphoglycerate mutase (AlkP superfamily)